MAIALVGTPTGGGLAAASTSITATVPTAAQGLTNANTLLLLSVAGRATSIAAIATPAGWSVWHANTASGTTFEVVTFFRFASAEPTSYTLSGLTSGVYAWNIRAYSGVDGTTPKDVTETQTINSTGNPTPSAITPVTTGAWIDVTVAIVTASGVTTTTYTSSNMTKDTDWTSTTGSSTNAAGGTAHLSTWVSGAFSPNLTQATGLAARGIAITSAIRPAASSGATGTLAATEDNDTLAASGTETFTGTLAATEANDTLAAAGTETFTGTLASTEAADTLVASGSVGGVTGTLAATEGADTLVGAGSEKFTGTLAATEANDTLASSGAETFTGTLAATEAADTLVANGVAGGATGTLAATEGPDTLAVAATEKFTGTLASTEAADTLAAAASETFTGILAVVEGGDTFVAVGTGGASVILVPEVTLTAAVRSSTLAASTSARSLAAAVHAPTMAAALMPHIVTAATYSRTVKG